MIAKSVGGKASTGSLSTRARGLGAYPETPYGASARCEFLVEFVYVMAGLGGMVAAVCAPVVGLGLLMLGGVSAAAGSMDGWLTSASLVDQTWSAISRVTFYCAAATILSSLLFMTGAACGVILEAQPGRRRE